MDGGGHAGLDRRRVGEVVGGEAVGGAGLGEGRRGRRRRPARPAPPARCGAARSRRRRRRGCAARCCTPAPRPRGPWPCGRRRRGRPAPPRPPWRRGARWRRPRRCRARSGRRWRRRGAGGTRGSSARRPRRARRARRRRPWRSGCRGSTRVTVPTAPAMRRPNGMSSGEPIVPASAMATPRPAPATPGTRTDSAACSASSRSWWATSISLDHGRRRTALVAAEPAEGHLDALHLFAGGDEPVGGAPQRALVEQAQLADQQVGRRGQLGDREHLEAVVERGRGELPRRLTASIRAVRSVGRFVGQGGGGLPGVGVEPLGPSPKRSTAAASSSAAARQRSARSHAGVRALARRWRSASTPAVPDCRVAASARTRSSWASTSAYWRRAAPSWAWRSCSSSDCELGAHGGGGLLLGRAPPRAAR